MFDFLLPPISWALLAEIFTRFLLLSLLATGGVISLAPEIYKIMVGDLKLLNDVQFTTSLAIAQSAPGPNVLFLTVMGWQAAGFWGALSVTVGALIPSAILALWVRRISDARADQRWVRALREGLAPVVIGLTFASAWILSKPWKDNHPILVFVGVAALLAAFSRVSPLLLILFGALIGIIGFRGI